MSPCRFPPPWSAELQPNYYVVRDADGQQLAYVYYENEPGRRSAAKLLTNEEGSGLTQYEKPCKPSMSTFHVSVMASTPATASHKAFHPSWRRPNFSLSKICVAYRSEGTCISVSP